MAIILNGTGPITGVSSINTTVDSTELGYLDGVTSALQTQINNLQTQINNMSTYGYFSFNSGTTIASGVGVTIPFNNTYLSNGISLSSNSFTFSRTGIYMLDWGCRPGTASDVWSVIDLYNSTTGIVGKSFGFGTIATDVGARTAHFMAQITNTSVAYTLRMSRSSSMAIDDPAESQAGYPETIPAIGLTIWKVG